MRKFKPKFTPQFLLVIVFGVPLGALLIYLDPDLTLKPIIFLMSMSMGLISGAIVLLLLISLFSVEIDSSGIRAANTWGVKQKLKWDEITNCRPFNLLGLRYVRLYGGKSRWGIWLPDFLSNKQEFINLTFEFAPTSNPIIKYYNNPHPNNRIKADGQTQRPESPFNSDDQT